GVQHFGYDAQPKSIPRFGKNLQPLFTQALKRIRRSARLERAASKQFYSARSDDLRDRHRLVVGFNSARSGDDSRLRSADIYITDAHEGVFVLQIAAHQFIRLRDAYRLRDTGKHLKVCWIDRALITGDADRGASRSGHWMRLESEVAYDLEHFFHLSVGGAGFHYDEHKVLHPLGCLDPQHIQRANQLSPDDACNRNQQCATRCVLL